MVPVIIVAYSKVPTGEAKDPALLRVNVAFVVEEHARAGVNNESAQNVHHPGKMLDQFRAQRDHHSAHDQRPDYTPFQEAMLQALIHGKHAKDHQEKKQVVDPESLFDQVTREKLQRRLRPAEIKNSGSKEEGDRNPAETRECRFANFDFVRAPMENAQVQRDRNNDEKIERNPV